MSFSVGPNESAGLLVEEFDFPVDAPAVTAQIAVGTDDAVAGDDVHHGVATDSPTHRPCRLGHPDAAGDVQIRGDQARRNRQKIAPDGQLESGAPKVQVQMSRLFGFPFQHPDRLTVKLHLPASELGVREMPFQLLDRLPTHLAGHEVADALGGGGNQVSMGGNIDQTIVDGQPLLLAGKFALGHRNYPDGTGCVLFHNNVK